MHMRFLFSDFLRLSCEKTIRRGATDEGRKGLECYKTNGETLDTLRVSEAVLCIANGQIVTTYNVLPKRVQSTARGASTTSNYPAVRSTDPGSSAAGESSFSVGECSHGRCPCATSYLLLSFLFPSRCTSRTAGCCARFAYERFPTCRDAMRDKSEPKTMDSGERDFILSHIPGCLPASLNCENNKCCCILIIYIQLSIARLSAIDFISAKLKDSKLRVEVTTRRFHREFS